MSERLIIQNFAGIKDISIDLSEINVLIGPQATGKSICAKSIYYFKSFLNELINAVEAEQTKRQFDANFLQKFENYFPLQNLENKDFLLRYEVADTFIQVEQSKSKLKLSYSDYYKRELNTWRGNYRTILERLQGDNQTLRRFESIRTIRRQFFLSQSNRLSKFSGYSQVFIPAGRSFFAILQSTIFSFLSSNKAIDPFLTEFGSFYEGIKLSRSINAPRTDEDKELKSKIDQLVESILSGRHIIEKGNDFLRLSDGRKISLANSSSGQQEMLPLALILGSIPFSRSVTSTGNVVFIEEPEAHLFPSAQKKIVNLIATIYNESKIPVQFIITTHSPYILTAFNNLIFAGSVSTNLAANQASKLETIVPEEQLLKSNEVCVYSLHDGVCDSIISEETGLISTSMLDAVSDELAIQFDNILEIE